MEDKKPCIGCPDMNLDEYGYLCDLACGKRTAWLNHQAGMKEMVEIYKRENPDAYKKYGTWWQAQLDKIERR